MGVFLVDPDKTSSVIGRVVCETVQRPAKGVLRNPTVVNKAERLSLGRGRWLNMNMDNKVVAAQNGTRGILVSDRVV